MLSTAAALAPAACSALRELRNVPEQHKVMYGTGQTAAG